MRNRGDPIPSSRRGRYGAAILLSLLLGSLSCSREKGTESKAHPDFPPLIISVNILPENPNVTNDLNPVIRSQDPDGDSITYQYRWIKNEKEIPGENRSTLTSGNFRKGDLISIKIVPSDGKVEGVTFLSAPVKILNSPPKVQEVRVEPRVAYALSDLKTNVKTVDSDGDFIYYTYRWDKNGTILTEETGDVLEKGRFKKGDSITVTVTPDDREVQGSPQKSDPIVISNSPPVIISFPPASVQGSTYIYQVKATDADGDPITLTLKAGPKGMEIDRNTGIIRWEVQKEVKGIHSVEVEASDQEGAKSAQRYTLSVEVK